MDWSTFRSISITFFAYTAHTNIFPVYDELKSRGMRRMNKVTKRSVGLEFLLYVIFGTSAYLVFKNDVDGDILNNFDDNNYLIMAGRIAITLSLFIALPVNINPARKNFESLFFKDKPFSTIRHIIFTLLLMIIVVLLAIYVPSVSIVFSVLGATCCVYLCFILPVTIYLKIFQYFISKSVRRLLITGMIITTIIGAIACVEIILNPN